MWNDLVLYAEHTFTSWGGYSRPQSDETVRQFEVKDQFAVDGRLRVNAILDQSLSQLADKIHVPAPAFVVFNPLSWTAAAWWRPISMPVTRSRIPRQNARGP